MMKRKAIALLFFGTMAGLTVFPQANYSSNFKIIKKIETTPVKDQANSGTCWAFATTSFLETELIRMGKGEFDLSEMYFVNKAYREKAKLYLELQGTSNFSPGGQAHDVINVLGKYGMITEEAYPGLNYGEEQHNHSELNSLLYAMLKVLNEKKMGYKSKAGLEAIDAVLETYLGEVPKTFTAGKKVYSAQSFVTETGLDPSDYVELSSFEAYPYYKKFILRVPDNWSADSYFNLPMDELLEVMNSALKNGYSVCWDGDVSGDFGRGSGVADMDEDVTVNSAIRNKLFDKQITTDDHLMHITGLAKGKYGGNYFLTKNSWSTDTKYEGYWFMSEDFVKINTIAILVHKDAIPDAIAEKLGLK